MKRNFHNLKFVLLNIEINFLTDTYVKTYLVANSNKRLQKKKTSTVRASVDPVYRQKIKYSASNVHGRFVQVINGLIKVIFFMVK